MSVNSILNQIASRSTVATARTTTSRAESGSRSRFARILANATATTNTPATTTTTTPARTTNTTTTPNTGSIAAPADQANNSSGPNVFGLVTPPQPSTDPVTPPTPAPVEERPTAESVFGSNVWLAQATGYSNSGGSYNYNTSYFATQATAEKVAQMLGGRVVMKNFFTGDNGPFFQNQPNYMVELPNGHLVNPGLTATYYTHGWSQSQIDTMLGYDRNV